MLSVKKQEIIRKIEANIERGEIVNGTYSWAKITSGKQTLKIYADRSSVDGGKGSVILKYDNKKNKHGVEYRGSNKQSNARYYNLSVLGWGSLSEHQLLAVALIPGASEKLCSEVEKYDINHKTIYLASIVARREYKKYDVDRTYAINSGDDELLEALKKEKIFTFQPPCDVSDLELCTSSENNSHQGFINKYGLHNISISAKDIQSLKNAIKFCSCGCSDDKVNKVVLKIMSIYITYGVDGVKKYIYKKFKVHI